MLVGADVMPVDEQRLVALRGYADAESGVSERFLDTRLGPAQAFAIATEPLAEPRSTGFVIVPSVGPEHGNLRRLETLVAHALATAGFPVLRIRPDVHPLLGAVAEIDLTTRIAEVEDAVSALTNETRSESVGLLGAMFGAVVAALVAERLDVSALAFVEPVMRGSQYLRGIMRRQAVADVIAGDNPEASATSETVTDELERVGSVSIRGLVLTKEQYDAVSAVSLEDGLSSFSGRSLVLGISPTGAAAPRLQKLVDRLRELGGDARLDVLTAELVAPFGEYYYRNAGPVRIDTRLELDRDVARRLVAWADSGAWAGRRGAL